MVRSSLRHMCLLAAIVLVMGAALAGCAKSATPHAQPLQPVAPPVEPAPADLSDPTRAVASYLAWVSYAYRTGVSDVATPTMSPEEGVRVDSYVQLDTERGRRIDQRLVSFDPRPASVDATRAVIGAHEVWEYRYLSPDGIRATSATNTASYDTTYTVVEIRPGAWVVDKVEAKALGTVK